MSQLPEIQELLARVTTVTAEVLGFDATDVSKDSLIREDLGADSLDLITLVWALEEEFGGKIEESKLPELTSPQKIAEYILARMNVSPPDA